MTTAFSTSTATSVGSFTVPEELSLRTWGMALSPTGNKLYLVSLVGSTDAGRYVGSGSVDVVTQIGLSCEMLGSALEAFERTLEYLKERKQFGSVIGSFQALQHRAAIMFTELELTKSAVVGALNAVDENSNDRARFASLAKFKAGETLHLVSNEAVQMHGGIGVTDEFDIGFFLKRSRVAEQIFGSSDYHIDRYATLSEY